MSVIDKGAFGKALWPGINSWYGQAYEDWQPLYTDLFDQFKSSKAFEEDVLFVGLGLAAVKPEGEPVTYDSMKQGFITRYTHLTYASGFIITKEMIQDDQYAVIGKKKAQALARSMRHTKEVVGANVYNRAFNSSYTGGDGLEMCSTAHLNVSGGTWANELTTAADLSEAALEQACIDIMKWTDDRGLRINLMAQSLIIPPDLAFEAERILRTPLRSGTSDNDINALRSMGKIPGGIKVNPYLTDTDAWFLRTNAADGLKYFSRQEDSFSDDSDFDSSNLKYMGDFRCSFGWTDPRGVFGSPGA